MSINTWDPIQATPDKYTYILFDDSHYVIGGFVERFKAQGIEISNEQHHQLILAYRAYVKNLGELYVQFSYPRKTDLILVDAFEMNRRLGHKISSFLNEHDKDCVVVTMDALCGYEGSIPLGLSRLYNPDGTSAKQVVERPGSAPMTDQILQIQKYLGGKTLVLSDDVVYTGGTIDKTLKLLSGDHLNGGNFQIDRHEVFAGIFTANLAWDGTVHGTNYDAVLRVEIPYGIDAGSVLDIGSGRDFIPGTDGLVTTAGRLPYINPMLSPNSRATIPTEHEREFSREVLDISENFYTRASNIVGMMWTTEVCEPSAVQGLAHFGITDSVFSVTSMLDVLERSRLAIDNIEMREYGFNFGHALAI